VPLFRKRCARGHLNDRFDNRGTQSYLTAAAEPERL
jgi:hypothetical protein